MGCCEAGGPIIGGGSSGPVPPSPPAEALFPENNLRWSMVVRDDEPASSVPMLGDDSGNGLVMATTTGASPGFSATAVNGLPGVTFLGGPVQSMFGEVLSDWAWLHQPPVSGALYGNFAAGLNSQTVFRTRTNAAGPGILLLWDGTALRFQFAMYDAAGNPLFPVLAGGLGSSPAGVHQVSFRVTSVNAALGPRSAVPNAELYVDGNLVASGATSGTPSTALPAAPLTWGSGFTGVQAFTSGAVRWACMHSRWYSDAELASLFDRRNTIVSQRTLFVPWLMGDSITAGAQCYRRWLDVRTRRTKDLFKRATGTQSTAPNFPGSDPIHDGVAGNTIANMIARVGAALPRDPTHMIVLAGTNDLGGSPPLGPIVASLQQLVTDMQARFPNIPIYVLTVPRGDGSVAGFNTSVDDFNALLPAAMASVGATLVDLYAPNAAYPYDNATDASDGVGHPTPIGGVKQGDNVANVVGLGSD